MSASLKISNILLAATLSAGSAAHANEPVNNNSATLGTNVINRVAQPKIIQQFPAQYLKGFFTDTVTSAQLVEIEETEFGTFESVNSPADSGSTEIKNEHQTASNVRSPSTVTQKTNTYLINQVCQGNVFYGECTTSRTKVEGLSRPAP